MAELGAEEIEAITHAVRAVVDRNEADLAALGALDHGDPYLWTKDYGQWGEVHLVMPPGDARSWELDAVALDDGSGFHAEVPMWTREEGRSDLTLTLTVRRDTGREPHVRFLDLHVL